MRDEDELRRESLRKIRARAQRSQASKRAVRHIGDSSVPTPVLNPNSFTSDKKKC